VLKKIKTYFKEERIMAKWKVTVEYTTTAAGGLLNRQTTYKVVEADSQSDAMTIAVNQVESPEKDNVKAVKAIKS
jgi:hypothetical protein